MNFFFGLGPAALVQHASGGVTVAFVVDSRLQGREEVPRGQGQHGLAPGAEPAAPKTRDASPRHRESPGLGGKAQPQETPGGPPASLQDALSSFLVVRGLAGERLEGRLLHRERPRPVPRLRVEAAPRPRRVLVARPGLLPALVEVPGLARTPGPNEQVRCFAPEALPLGPHCDRRLGHRDRALEVAEVEPDLAHRHRPADVAGAPGLLRLEEAQERVAPARPRRGTTGRVQPTPFQPAVQGLDPERHADRVGLLEIGRLRKDVVEVRLPRGLQLRARRLGQREKIEGPVLAEREPGQELDAS